MKQSKAYPYLKALLDGLIEAAPNWAKAPGKFVSSLSGQLQKKKTEENKQLEKEIESISKDELWNLIKKSGYEQKEDIELIVNQVRIIPEILRTINYHFDRVDDKLEEIIELVKQKQKVFYIGEQNTGRDIYQAGRDIIIQQPIEREDEKRKTKQITLVIDNLEAEQFDANYRRMFCFGIAGFLGIEPSDVKIVNVEKGSIIVTVEVPENLAGEINKAVKNHSREFENAIKPLIVVSVGTKVDQMLDKFNVARNLPPDDKVSSEIRRSEISAIMPSGAVSFDRITVPRVENSGKSVRKPHDYPFDVECSNYFQFGTVNPVLDVTIVNHSDKPVLITSIGVEVVSVAQTWLVGAILEPRIVRVSALVKITMPDIWKKLRERGRGRFTSNISRSSDDGLSEMTLKDIIEINIPPQKMNERVLYEIPDPVQLDVNTPFRYILLLDEYLKNIPDEAILKLWVATNQGEYSSSPIYMFVLGNVLHAKAMTKEEMKLEHEINPLLEEANKYFEAGKFYEAKPLIERALELRESALGREHPDVVLLRHNLGVLHYYLGQFSEAERIYKQTIPLIERQLGSNHPEIEKYHHDLQLLHEVMKKRIEGARVVLPEKGPPQISEGFFEDWKRLEDSGQYDIALKMGKELIHASEKYYGSEHKDMANLLNKVGTLYWKAGRYQEAAELFERSLKIRQQHYGAMSSVVANSYNNLASTYREQGMYERSEVLYKQAIEILDNLGEYNTLSNVLSYYEKLLKYMSRDDDAEKVRKRIESIRQSTSGEKSDSKE